MSYRQSIEDVKSRLKLDQIPFRCQVGWPLLPWSISGLERKLGCPVPADLATFYREIGNGFRLIWVRERASTPDVLLGGIHVPSAGLLIRNWRQRRKSFLYDSASAEKYGFPHTDDPDLAKKTAARMWEWLPIVHFENGDELSIDLSDPKQPILFDKHDWLDGGSGDNGFFVADNWRTLFESWAGYCFQHPKSLYWPKVMTKSGINWRADDFDQTLVVQSK